MLVAFMIGIVGSPVSAAKANVDANAGMDGFTQEQVELSIAIMNNLESYNDSNGNVQIKILNEKDLENQLNNFSVDGYSVSFDEFEEAVSHLKRLSDLEEGLHRKRLISYGGLLKEIHKKLNLDDAEEGDLIHTNDEEKTDEDGYSIIALWNWERQNYFIKV